MHCFSYVDILPSGLNLYTPRCRQLQRFRRDWTSQKIRRQSLAETRSGQRQRQQKENPGHLWVLLPPQPHPFSAAPIRGSVHLYLSEWAHKVWEAHPPSHMAALRWIKSSAPWHLEAFLFLPSTLTGRMCFWSPSRDSRIMMARSCTHRPPAVLMGKDVTVLSKRVQRVTS